MKHTLVRLTGLLIVVMLVFSGCNLIGTDQIMQLEQDMAAMQKQYSGVVASYDGGEITQEDVMASFASQYSYMSQLYAAYYGTGITADTLASIEESVVENAVQDVAVARELESRGLALDEDKLAEVQESADDTYQQAYDSFYASAEGSTDEVRAKQTEYDLYSNGYTREALYNIELAEAQYDLLEETVEAEITEVTDDELNAAYEEKVAEDEETYTSAPGSYGSAMTAEDAAVYWVPEGYRTVKHILVIPEEDVLTAVTDARSAYSDGESALEDLRSELDALNDDDAEEADEAPRAAEDIQADIDQAEADLEALQADVKAAEAACLASVQDVLDEIYEKIGDGEDFEALIEEYGEDPGMQNEPTKTLGYYVSADSTNWDENFAAGAMALENIGDVSETPVISTSGVHIIRYESDVEAGAVALEDVKDALYEETLETLKADHFNAELESWIDALNPEYHLEAFDLG